MNNLGPEDGQFRPKRYFLISWVNCPFIFNYFFITEQQANVSISYLIYLQNMSKYNE